MEHNYLFKTKLHTKELSVFAKKDAMIYNVFYVFLILLFMSTSSLLPSSSTDSYYINITREYYHFLLLEAVEILGHTMIKEGLENLTLTGYIKGKRDRNSE